MLKLIMSVLVLSVVGCGKGADSGAKGTSLPPINIVQKNVLVKSRATLKLSTGTPTVGMKIMNLLVPQALAAVTQFVSVVNSPSSTLALSTLNFNPPAITNANLDFGSLDVSALFDNNLDLCGDSGTDHCGTALIRIYTTGEAGAGMYNAHDDFGAPITVSQGGVILSTVGLGSDNSSVTQAFSIPTTKHVVSLADFGSPSYDIAVDFSNAGAGNYETTIVIEYALAP